MIDRVRSDDTVVDELDQAREQEERLRWINARVREASEADLIEDADVVPEEDDLPVVDEA